MRKLIYYTILFLFAIPINSCSSSKKGITITPEEQEIFGTVAEDQVTLESEESNYELIIIDIGFNRWLQRIAQPRGYYSQSFLERRNRILVIEWNNRVIMPTVYDPILYELQIIYDPNVDYGYEVNYQLYNYFIYFQRKYNQRLGPFLPRI